MGDHGSCKETADDLRHRLALAEETADSYAKELDRLRRSMRPRLKCKHCSADITTHRAFMRAEAEVATSWCQGVDLEAKWEPVAAGVFCGVVCLRDFLNKLASAPRDPSTEKEAEDE